MKHILIAGIALCAFASPAAADPIVTPIVAELLGAAGISGSVAGVSIASVVSSLVTAGVGLRIAIWRLRA